LTGGYWTTISESLNLDIWNDVSICISAHSSASISAVDQAVMKGEYLL
jgi:hypothetical protein